MVKTRIFIAGAGHIGPSIAHILSQDDNYDIVLADQVVREPMRRMSHITTLEMDLGDPGVLDTYLTNNPADAIVCCLPYFLTLNIAKLAHKHHAHYFDLTEDVHAGDAIQLMAQNSSSAFVPHCGLAPGFINIVAHSIMSEFDQVEEAKLRCGALPQSSSNALQYARSWSTDGLINEYLNPCMQLVDGTIAYAAGLDDVEDIQIDGAHYEAFNTSGGIGTLVQTHENKVRTLNYKTIRYPGHVEKMRFLARGLKLDHDRATLKRIVENAVPLTEQDEVIVYVAVVGTMGYAVQRKAFVRKYLPMTIASQKLTAIQATTATGASAVIDIVLSNKATYKGFVKQEDFSLNQLLQNRFGKVLS